MKITKKKTKLQEAQDSKQIAMNETNKRIEILGNFAEALYKTLGDIQAVFDVIRNVPSDEVIKYEKTKKISESWKKQVDCIEEEYRKAEAKSAGSGAAGVGAGVAVVAMGPTAAMGVATTFGVASTGTAISSLSGAAATNAALAWLGGGALATGGGGIAAGEAFLALAGPVGWAIAGVSLLASGFFLWKNLDDRKRLEEIFISINERDEKSYCLAIVELNERIKRITDETRKLQNAIGEIKKMGTDYTKMTEEQQYELGSYVNLMFSTSQLLVNPIQGLLPKYTMEDFGRFASWPAKTTSSDTCNDHPDLIVMLSNLLYKIVLNDKEKKLVWKSLRSNKKMLESINLKKKDFDVSIIDAVYEALNFKYIAEKLSNK